MPPQGPEATPDVRPSPSVSSVLDINLEVSNLSTKKLTIEKKYTHIQNLSAIYHHTPQSKDVSTRFLLQIYGNNWQYLATRQDCTQLHETSVDTPHVHGSRLAASAPDLVPPLLLPPSQQKRGHMFQQKVKQISSDDSSRN